MAIRSINPANGTLLRSFKPLTEEALQGKLAAARKGFGRYSDVTLEHRVLWMKKLAYLLDSELEEFASLITSEMGKTIAESREEMRHCIALCRYYAELAARMLIPETISTDGRSSYVRWDSQGVILMVVSWSSPFWNAFCSIVPALMGGNTGLLRHSSHVPQCALVIEAVVRRAGFPVGAIQVLLIDETQIEVVLNDEIVVGVAVNDSESTGRAIAAQAGWLIKQSALTLEGCDAFVVMPSADLARSVQEGVKARCVNNGQSPSAANRFLIHEDVYDEFELLFSAAMEELRIGDPAKDGVDIGPLVSEAALRDVEEYVAAALAAGGELLTGGERMLGAGYFYEPTVIVDVPREAAVYRKNVKGPVAMLYRVGSLDEAIEAANNSPFGLGASTWTRDVEEQRRLIAELECGSVFVNTVVMSDPALPFGGIRQSGYGRLLSATGVREFMNAKAVVIADAERREAEADLPRRETTEHQVAGEVGFDRVLERSLNPSVMRRAVTIEPRIDEVKARGKKRKP